jgi:FkbM family methyltransferase
VSLTSSQGQSSDRAARASFALVEIPVAGQAVRLPDLPRYRKFYRKLASGAWEPRTFGVLAANLDKSTTYLDIGAWIGVTPFWASGLAKLVIAVEPDPSCREILLALAPLYPNVEVVEGALSPESSVTIQSVSGFGSSETSALDIGDGETIAVPGVSIDALMARASDGPVFVKIDIEGYEYAIQEEIARLAHYQPRGLQCAVHPQLVESTMKGPVLLKRLRVAIATIRLWRTLSRVAPRRSVPRYGGFLRYLLLGLLLRRRPKGTDFLFLHASRRT